MADYINSLQDNIYYNIEINNEGGQYGKPLVYSANLNEPIVKNASQYYCTICDFAIPLSSIPVMIMPILPNSGFTNMSNMYFMFYVDGVAQPAFNLIFIPEQTTYSQVNQNNPSQAIITPYYFLYSYTSLINMMNIALAKCYAALQLSFPTYAQAMNGTPFFQYDPATQLISLITHISYATNITQAHTVNIAISDTSLNYLEGFSYVYTTDNMAKPIDIFNIYSYNNNGYPTNTYPTAPTYIINTQSYNTIQYWSDLKKIIIVSNSLPLAPECIQENGSNVNQVNYNYILSSFTPLSEAAGDGRSICYYSPTSQYRLIDCTGSDDIKRIDCKVFWEDNNNNWYPMFLEASQSCTIRLAFVNRDLYSSKLLKKM